MPGAGLSIVIGRKASLDMSALKPYWGKPAVRFLERVLETSASCEARLAPGLYSTSVLIFDQEAKILVVFD
jgi:hypothetical protein